MIKVNPVVPMEQNKNNWLKERNKKPILHTTKPVSEQDKKKTPPTSGWF